MNILKKKNKVKNNFVMNELNKNNNFVMNELNKNNNFIINEINKNNDLMESLLTEVNKIDKYDIEYKDFYEIKKDMIEYFKESNNLINTTNKKKLNISLIKTLNKNNYNFNENSLIKLFEINNVEYNEDLEKN